MNFVSLNRNPLHWLLPLSFKFMNFQIPSLLTDPASCLLWCLEWSLSSTHSSGEFSLILLWAPVLSQELDRHWERSRDSNPNIGCFPISKNTHVFPFGKIKLIYTIKIALKQQQSPGNREEISMITCLTLPGSFHTNWTSCYTTHMQNLPSFFRGRLFWCQNTRASEHRCTLMTALTVLKLQHLIRKTEWQAPYLPTRKRHNINILMRGDL